jgi:hypothetical protein
VFIAVCVASTEAFIGANGGSGNPNSFIKLLMSGKDLKFIAGDRTSFFHQQEFSRTTNPQKLTKQYFYVKIQERQIYLNHFFLLSQPRESSPFSLGRNSAKKG